MVENFIIVSMQIVALGECFVYEEIVIAAVSPSGRFLPYHLKLPHLFNESISDALHELLDVDFK